MRFDQQIVGYQTKHERRRRWYKIVSALACIVVFCTTYALILPALTMETPRVLECPLVVHEHTADCYDAEGGLICGQADFVVHTHDEDCYDEDGHLVCTLPEIEAHEHTEACYTEEAVLICGERETNGHRHDDSCYIVEETETAADSAAEPHVHTDACYMQTEVLHCGERESERHRHDDGCYTVELGELLCGRAEHAHDESCYDEAGGLICGSEAHEHADGCYEQTSVLACGMEEGEDAHIHDSGCYDTAHMLICELAEDGDASEPEKTLICELEEGEGAHIHDDGCYEWQMVQSCGKEEVILHEHDDDCYEEVHGENGELISRVLVCGRLEVLEHVHTGACFRVIETPEIIVPNSTYTYEDSAVSVEVTLAEGTTVPADAALRVQPITSSDETYDYDALVQWAKDSVEGEAAGIALYDISFYTAEEEYIPVADTATVSIRFKEPVLPEGGTVTVLHYEEDETAPVMLDAVDVEQDENEALSALTFQTEGFSVFAVVTLAEDGAGDIADDYTGDWIIVNTYKNVAMQAAANTNGGNDANNRAAQAVSYKEADGQRYPVSTNSSTSLTVWHFEKQSDGTYYISTTVDGKTNYLYIGSHNTAVTLSDTAQNITVTEGTGDRAGKVRFTAESGGAINLFGGSAERGFGSWADQTPGNNEYQTLYHPMIVSEGTLIYDINVPNISSRSTGWQTTPSLDSTVQSIGETGGSLFAQPKGYTTELGTAGIANLYRFGILGVDDLLSSPAYTNGSMGSTWYGEERFDGWTCTVDGTT